VILLLQQVYDYQNAHTIWEALRSWLNAEPVPGWRFTPFWSHALMLISALIFIFLFELLMTIGLQVWERRVLGRMQRRWGPQVLGGINRATFRRVLLPIIVLLAVPAVVYAVDQYTPLKLGALPGHLTVLCTFAAFLTWLAYVAGWLWRQGFADALKLFVKQDVVPLNADRFLFMFAPLMVYLPSLLSWVVLPFGVAIIQGHYVYYALANINVGLLLIIADFSFFLVAVIIAGYGSNNKYALVGAMREAAELLTYEVPMLMSLLCVALFAGSLNLIDIVKMQDSTWAILPLFPAFAIFFITAIAETNRPPFDLPEASNELLGGFVVEYSGLRFALFYVAEYANVFLACAEMVVCFLGGWHGPAFLGPDGLWLTSLFWFLLKTYLLIFAFIWVRATMPRIRIDQVMFFSWKFLVPASLVALALTGIGVVYRHPWFSANHLWLSDTHLNPLTGLPMGEFAHVTTRQALRIMTLPERAFFWTYNAVLAAIAAFLTVLVVKILAVRRQHPLPRREVTWT
jgi:NADH-quinone oxidoreductase subunit H